MIKPFHNKYEVRCKKCLNLISPGNGKKISGSLSWFCQGCYDKEIRERKVPTLPNWRD